MGRIRVGTVGYSYRDWVGAFYPAGTPQRRQLAVYAKTFDSCELTQFCHHMPDAERIAVFAAQVRTDLKFFVRIHNTFTHCADVGLALNLAGHFRKAMEPLFDAGKLAGLVAAFPYAFKESVGARQYVEQLAHALKLGDMPLQVDFRHPSWLSDECIRWAGANRLGLVCVDEPRLPGLLPPMAVATADVTLVRLHGRNAQSWWSGNSTTRHDYSYDPAELAELRERYAPLIGDPQGLLGPQAHFLFQNHWQAQSVWNARQWRALVLGGAISSDESRDAEEAAADECLAPPVSLPLSEVKSRVSRVLAEIQPSLDLPARLPPPRG